MSNRVFYDDEARAKVLAGARQIYKAVSSTLGPLGRNAVIRTKFSLPVPTHDGVTVARSIQLPHEDDEHLGEDVGADMMKLAAAKVNDVVGDGTTTVTVIAYHILDEAHKLIAAGHNPMQLKRQLDAAAERVLRLLPIYVEKISSKERIREVALISAGGDEHVANIIADIMHQVGVDGAVTVEQSQGQTVSSELAEGYKSERGLVSPYMVTDTQRMRAVVEAIGMPVPIVVTDAILSNAMELVPLFEKIASHFKQKQVVVICDDMTGDALQTFVKNKIEGNFATFAVKAPAFGDRRKEILEDIATLTGGKVISREQGIEFSDATVDMIGTARRVLADKDSTIIIEGGGDPEDVQTRIKELKQRADSADSEFNKEKLEERVAALSGKVAVIKVGGLSETEIEERKYRVDDAVFATKSAMKGGIVPGGGVTLLNMVDQYEDISGEPGESILLRALEQPFLKLMENSGHRAEFMREEVRRSAKPGFGYSVYEPDTLCDLKKAGIVDPAEVIKEAIRSAVSTAGTAITMGSLIVDVPTQLPASPVARVSRRTTPQGANMET